VLWTKAAFSACLACHWPDNHWQCNWRVAWTSSRMCAGKTADTSSNYCDNIQPYDKRRSVFVKCDTIFRLFFFGDYHNSILLSFARECSGNILKVRWEVLNVNSTTHYLAFQQWNNLENPLRIDKVIALYLVYYFLGHSVFCRITPKQEGFSSVAVSVSSDGHKTNRVIPN